MGRYLLSFHYLLFNFLHVLDEQFKYQVSCRVTIHPPNNSKIEQAGTQVNTGRHGRDGSFLHKSMCTSHATNNDEEQTDMVGMYLITHARKTRGIRAALPTPREGP